MNKTDFLRKPYLILGFSWQLYCYFVELKLVVRPGFGLVLFIVQVKKTQLYGRQNSAGNPLQHPIHIQPIPLHYGDATRSYLKKIFAIFHGHELQTSTSPQLSKYFLPEF